MKINLLTSSSSIKGAFITSLLFLANIFSFAQNKTYANSQAIATYGVCIGCIAESPNNAVGSNENDYSTLKINLGIAATIEQTLYFPTTVSFSKLVIGIGTDSSPLSVQLLKGVTIETMNNGQSNGDVQTIDSNLLKLGNQGASRATVEINTTKNYNTVKIKLNGGLLNLNDGLRIYYAHQTPNLFSSACITPPFNPAAYYPFNGNINNSLPGSNFINTNNSTPIFVDNTICNQGLGAPETSYTLKTADLQSLNSNGYTISFWAKTQQKQAGNHPSFTIDAYGVRTRILPDSLKMNYTPPHLGLDAPNLGEHEKAASISTEFNHYILLYLKDPGEVYLFKNGLFAGVNRSWKFTGSLNLIDTINITLDSVYIDEFIIYKKVLTPEEISTLVNSYNQSQSNIAAFKLISKTAPLNEILTVSPNPTSGQITLDGNILLIDSDISLRNIAGKEIYQSKFTSKTFALPTALADGVYILTVQTKDKKVYSRKIILKR